MTKITYITHSLRDLNDFPNQFPYRVHYSSGIVREYDTYALLPETVKRTLNAYATTSEVLPIGKHDSIVTFVYTPIN